MSRQNIYDDPVFFAGYAALRRNEDGLNAVLEQPAIWRLLPDDLIGKRVLDLGCGFGDFARWVRHHGAKEVVAVDVSARMLEVAKRQTCDPHIVYLHSAIEEFHFEPESYDLIVSSLALHYVENYEIAMQSIASALTTGGRLVFSVEHPICTAVAAQEWHRAPDGSNAHWPVDHYQEEGKRNTKWFVEGVIKYHRTSQSYVNGVLDTGLKLARFEEPEPAKNAIAMRPDLAEHRRRPPFLIIAADR